MIASVSKSLVIALVTIVCMLVVIVGAALPPLRAVAAILLVLVLPGYAVTRALFAARTWGRPERILFSLGGSLSLAVLSGLALNWSPWGLQTTSWTLFLGAVALVATALAMLRRSDDRITWFDGLSRPTSRQVVPLLLAGALLAGGYGVAAYGALLRPAAAFTQLWMLPVEQPRETVRVGVQNEEGSPIEYRLVLRAGVDVVQEWPSITLRAGEQWEMEVALAPDTRDLDLVASLYRNDQPNAVYRYVTLRAQG